MILIKNFQVKPLDMGCNAISNRLPQGTNPSFESEMSEPN